MSEDEKWLLYVYLDSARELVDYEVMDDDGGAVGSNWMILGEYESEEEARQEGERFVEEHLEDGYGRGRWTAPTF